VARCLAHGAVVEWIFAVKPDVPGLATWLPPRQIVPAGRQDANAKAR
jgi:hypothetical protein